MFIDLEILSNIGYLNMSYISATLVFSLDHIFFQACKPNSVDEPPYYIKSNREVNILW